MGIQQWAKVAIACAASISLSGCLILPGEFTSDMTVRRNGDFSFSYKGQIQLVGLATLLRTDFLNDGADAEFKAVCYPDTLEPASNVSDDLNIEGKKDNVAAAPQRHFAVLPASLQTDIAAEKDVAADAAKAAEDAAQAAADAAQAAASSWDVTERECTSDEIKQQKADWDTQQAEKKKRDEEGRKIAEMMLGGIDPENPETILRFTREVERLAAWHKVEHLGNGVFLVDYSTSGKLADDYAFPVIPRYALGEPMIHITRWDNERVRVEAPAFKTDPEMSMTALLGMGRLAGGMLGKAGSDKMPAEPVAIKGSFTLTTDARILANNSEDGPEETGGLAKLTWDIGPASYGAPMALLKLN
jgi:hypothetical protein